MQFIAMFKKSSYSIFLLKEIKLSSLRAKPQEEVAEDEQEKAAVVIAAAKKTRITQVKRHLLHW